MTTPPADALADLLHAARTYRPIYVAGLVADLLDAGVPEATAPALRELRMACLARFSGRTASRDRARLATAIEGLRKAAES